METLNQFGINPILLAAQIVNFFILLLILKRFLYGPILKVLAERKKRIEDSLKNAEEIETRLQEIAEQEAESIRKAAREGEKIIQQAQEEYSRTIEEAKIEYAKIVNKALEDAKKIAQTEKEVIWREIKENLAALVFLTYEKIIGKTPKEEQKKIIEQEIKNIS